LNVAAIGIGPAVVAQTGTGPFAVAERISAVLHTQVPAADAAILMQAYATHNPRAMRRAMAKYAARWRKLDARTKARLTAEIAQTQDGADAIFNTIGNEGEAVPLGSAQLPGAGACITVPAPTDFPHGLGTTHSGLDAGLSLSLTGPGVSFTLTRSTRGHYYVSFGSSVTGQALPLGAYTISGKGGADVGPFSATISVGSHLAISNKASLATLDRTQPATITWTGGIAGSYVLIGGEAAGLWSGFGYIKPSYFVCAEDGGKGTLTIPAYVLSAMNPTAAGKGNLLLSPHPLSNQIAIPGIDLAYFIDGSSDTVAVTFK
jgi:hypothetical protein